LEKLFIVIVGIFNIFLGLDFFFNVVFYSSIVSCDVLNLGILLRFVWCKLKFVSRSCTVLFRSQRRWVETSCFPVFSMASTKLWGFIRTGYDIFLDTILRIIKFSIGSW
jgi:hypothetical protein